MRRLTHIAIQGAATAIPGAARQPAAWPSGLAFAFASVTATLAASAAHAQSATPLPPIQVSVEPGVLCPLDGFDVDPATLAAHRAATSDTARLLANQPGASLQTGGGVSSLPVLHGLADDRGGSWWTA